MVAAKQEHVGYATVPKLWPGGTVVCIASGPSLTTEDVNYCHGRADGVIVVNDNYKLAPWADALIASDHRWWLWHRGVPSFHGLRYATSCGVRALAVKHKWRDIHILKNTGRDGLELEPNGLRNGLSSGYRAVNLAVHFGAQRIVLLGYDMKRGEAARERDKKEHWFGEHPVHSRSPYDAFRKCFNTIVEPLKALDVAVVNCSRETALECFDRMPVQEAL